MKRMPLPLDRVLFVSQNRAEAMRPPGRCGLISITDPGRAPAQLEDGWAAVLRLSFHDVDPISRPEEVEDLREITRAQAEQIARFCLSEPGCRRIVVHCRYGVSRSAAVAKALSEAAGLAFPRDYDDHNRFVYRLVLDTLRRALEA